MGEKASKFVSNTLRCDGCVYNSKNMGEVVKIDQRKEFIDKIG